MKELKALGWIALSIVAVAVVKTITGFVIGLFANDTGSSTAQGIAVFIAAIVITYAVWAIIGRLRR